MGAGLETPTLPLSTELLSTIDAFCQKHMNHDDQCAETLHQELLALYHKQVTPLDAEAQRHRFFFTVVNQLNEHLRSEARVRELWELAKVYLKSLLLDQELVKGLRYTATPWLLDFFVIGNGPPDKSPDDVVPLNMLLDQAVEIWATKYWYHGYATGVRDDGQEISVRTIMVEYGEKHPRVSL